jgi:hypothetical protein
MLWSERPAELFRRRAATANDAIDWPRKELYTPDGSRAFDTWTGGTLGVLNAQMEDFSKFTNAWFLQDEIRRR